MSQAYERITAALEAHGSQSRDVRQGHSMWQCPGHDDNGPSLAVDDKGDKALVYCHGGNCHTDDILAALGLEVTALFDADLSTNAAARSAAPQLVRSYLYEKGNGDPYFYVDRYYPKTFRQRLPGVEPVRDLADRDAARHLGISHSVKKPIVYHYPRLLRHMNAEPTEVWWLDGEKDVETAERHGLVATCPPGFAKWEPDYATAIKGSGATGVVMVVDQDKEKPDGTLGAGQQTAIAARMGFRSVGLKVRVVSPAVGKDLSDHFAAGYGPEAMIPDPSLVTRPRGVRADALMTHEFKPITWAVPHLLPTGLTILAGSPKAGKLARLSTPVLTPAGWSTMGALQVGDRVIGQNGKPTLVTAIHPQGRKAIYRVTLTDGASTECGADHLWSVQTHSQRQRQHRTGEPQFTVRTTAQIAEMLDRGVERAFHLPIVEPVEFDSGEALPIDPYALGLLLGDGCFSLSCLTFSKPDLELHEALMKALPDQEFVSKNQKKGEVRLVHGPLRSTLRDLGLNGHRSWEKFIPPTYLVAPVADRLALVQGLLDTDGWVERNPLGNTSAHYCTASDRLKDGLVELVESLGGVTRVGYKAAPKFQGGVGRPSWTVKVRLPGEMSPFRLARKADAWTAGRTNTNRPPDRSIKSVEYVDEDEAVCITVANPDGLYVTERYIVTHNSWVCLDVGCAVAAGGRALGVVPVDKGSVLYLAREDTYRRLQDRIKYLMGGTDSAPANLELVPGDVEWIGGEEGLSNMTEWAEAETNPRLVVIDTIAKVEPEMGEDRNRGAYSGNYTMMARYKHWADTHNIAVLMVHHDNKTKPDKDNEGWMSDPFTQISGTRGLTGAADTLLFLETKRFSTEGRLHITGRDVEEQSVEMRKMGALWALYGVLSGEE